MTGLMKSRLTTIALLGWIAAAAPALADIQIGAAGPFSGPNASLGEQLRRGVQMAVDDINATGGISGERLAVTFTDDGCDPRKAVDAATGFVSQGVKAVIGHYCSGASIPASKVYEKASVVMITPASTHPKLTDEGGWNVIRLVPRDDEEASAAARLVLEKFAGRKVAVLNDQAAADKALAARFRATLAAAGVTPVVDDSYKPGAKDYGDLALKLNAAGAEVLYIAGSYVESGLIARALRALSPAVQIIGTDALVTDDYWNIAKDAGEGTLMTFTYDPRKFPEARALADRFRAEDYAAEGFTLYAYAAVQAYASAASATSSADSHAIAAWLRGGSRIPTAVGPVSFDAKGDLRTPRVAWFRWINGRYTEIDPATLLPPVLNTTP